MLTVFFIFSSKEGMHGRASEAGAGVVVVVLVAVTEAGVVAIVVLAVVGVGMVLAVVVAAAVVVVAAEMVVVDVGAVVEVLLVEVAVAVVLPVEVEEVVTVTGAGEAWGVMRRGARLEVTAKPRTRASSARYSGTWRDMSSTESLLRLEAIVVMRPEFWNRVRRAGGRAGGA